MPGFMLFLGVTWQYATRSMMNYALEKCTIIQLNSFLASLIGCLVGTASRSRQKSARRHANIIIE